MPFIDKSPLEYQINTTTSVRRWRLNRAPTANDFKQFRVGDLWLDTSSNDWFILCYKDTTQAIWRKLAGTAAAIEYLVPDVGGVVGPDAVNYLNLLGGTGCTTVGTPASNQIVINVSGGGITWSREAGATVAAAVDHGYVNTNAGLTTITLPLTATLGTLIQIAGEGGGGWTIAQNAGQSIQFGNLSTTVGVGGSLSSTNQWDAVKIVCRVADTTWSVISNVGILNVV